MSAIAKVIEAFPLGRSNEELFLLCGAVFNSQKRIEILAELDVLQRGGVICKGRDGKWRPAAIQRSASGEKRVAFTESHPDHAMHAAPASFYQKSLVSVPADAIKTKLTAKPDEIVRYWRSALRSDPRGKITTRPDLHRVDWHMVVGQGPIINDGGTRIDVPLDGLGPEFRQALLRREAIDASLAIGWPISISKKSGMPVIRPIGLFSASWRREDGSLMVDIEDPDVLVNPDWLTGAARELGYSRAEMPLFFSSEEGNALDFPDFVQRLREVAAGHIVGRLSGELPKASIDPSVSGIHDAVALFLPGESSFTAGASADLDKIAGWSKEDLSRTALAPCLVWTGGRKARHR